MFSTSKVNACSCGDDTDTKTIFSSSDTAFIGKIIKIEIVKEAGIVLPFKETKDGLKPTRWEKEVEKARRVTFQVVEPFKGVKEKTFTLTSSMGSICDISFKIAEIYLVLARKIRPYIIEETDEPYEKRLKEKVNRFNKNLPFYITGVCDLTYNLKSRETEVQEIRNFLKNGIWNEPKETPLQ